MKVIIIQKINLITKMSKMLKLTRIFNRNYKIKMMMIMKMI